MTKRIGDRGEIAGGVVLHARQLAQRTGHRRHPVERRLVGEGAHVADGIGDPRDVAGRVVDEAGDPAERVGRRRDSPGGVALVAEALAERVDRFGAEARIVQTVKGDLTARIGHRGRGVRGDGAGVGEAPRSAVGLSLADHATLRIVLVGEERDASSVGDARDPARRVVGIARQAAGRIRHGLETEGGAGGIAVAYGPSDRVGDDEQTRDGVTGGVDREGQHPPAGVRQLDRGSEAVAGDGERVAVPIALAHEQAEAGNHESAAHARNVARREAPGGAVLEAQRVAAVRLDAQHGAPKIWKGRVGEGAVPLEREGEARVAGQDEAPERRGLLEQHDVDAERPTRAGGQLEAGDAAERVLRVVTAAHERRHAAGHDEIGLVDQHESGAQVDGLARFRASRIHVGLGAGVLENAGHAADATESGDADAGIGDHAAAVGAHGPEPGEPPARGDSGHGRGVVVPDLGLVAGRQLLVVGQRQRQGRGGKTTHRGAEEDLVERACRPRRRGHGQRVG